MENFTYRTFTGIEYTNSFDLEINFLNDIYDMSRTDFIKKYEDKFPYFTETPIKYEGHNDGYVDLSEINYYLVPSKERWKYDYLLKKVVYQKVSLDEWEEFLCKDGRNFLKINQGITKEHFVYIMVKYINENYQESNLMEDSFIIDKCKEIWDYYKVNDYVDVNKKKFKIIKEYWIERGIDNWLVVGSKIRSRLKKNSFSKWYDESKSLEDNISLLKEKGINTTKSTLKNWCDECGYTCNTRKELRNKVILEVYNEDRSRSYREIEKIVNDRGYKVGDDTIMKIIKEYNKNNDYSTKTTDILITINEPHISYGISEDGFSASAEKPLSERSEERNKCLKNESSLFMYYSIQ